MNQTYISQEDTKLKRSPIPKTRGELQSFQRSRAKWLSHRQNIKKLTHKNLNYANTCSISPMLTKEEILRETVVVKDPKNSAKSTVQKLDSIESKTFLPKVDYRKRLIEFYEKYCPDKLKNVDKNLETYRGREDEMFQKLEAKYVHRMKASKYPIPSGIDSNPKCFMDIRIGSGELFNLQFQLYDHIVPLAAENFRCLCSGEKVRII